MNSPDGIQPDQDRPRLLFVCMEYPYPVTKGIRNRQALQIETLASDFHLILACTHSTIELESPITIGNSRIEVLPWEPPRNSKGRLFSASSYCVTNPLLRGYQRTAFLASLHSRKFDLLWVSRLDAAWTLGPIRGILPSVLDLDDVESRTIYSIAKLSKSRRISQRLGDIVARWRLSKTERAVGLDYSVVTLSAETDIERFPLSRARLLPNCAPQMPERRQGRSCRLQRLMFIGTLEYPPNLHGLRWFLANVWPKLLSSRPKLILEVIGEGGERIADLRKVPGVRVHGLVNDPTLLWDQCSVAIAPIFAGGGTRLKILDAWQRGVPVVSTSVGVAGLSAVDGVHVLVGDTAEVFAEGCEALLSSEVLRERISLAGTILCDDRYSRQRVVSIIRSIAQEAMTAGTAIKNEDLVTDS